MNPSFTEEQQMLRDVAQDFLRSRFPVGRLATASDDVWDPESWSDIAELGWTAISVSEDRGGVGLGLVEEAVVAEELGLALFPGPFVSTVALALPVLEQAPDLLAQVVSGSATATLAGLASESAAAGGSCRATRQGSGWRLQGECAFVADLLTADLLTVVARGPDGSPGVWLVDRDAEGVELIAQETLDALRPLGVLRLHDADCRIVAEPGAQTRRLLERTRDRALVLLAAEVVGIAECALRLGVEHARERRQFGRPIGAFQAVSHELANAYVEIESGRSLAYWAAWAVQDESPDSGRAAAAAKAYASEAAVRTIERALQIHGGVGFTWEHPMHRLYRRALWDAAYLGWPRTLHRSVGGELLDAERRSDE